MRRPDRKQLGRWLRNGLLFVAVVAVISAWQVRNMAEGPAPALAGLGVHGEVIDLGQRRGAPVLVYFWADWCPICRLEKGTVDSLAADYPIVTVAMNSGDEAAVSAYLQEHGLHWPTLADPDGGLATMWGVRGVPAFFIVDGDGVIRHRAVGYTSGLGLRARLWLAR